MKHATTLVKVVDGEVHVQKLGEEHVVEGSTYELLLPAGVTVFIRHLAAGGNGGSTAGGGERT